MAATLATVGTLSLAACGTTHFVEKIVIHPVEVERVVVQERAVIVEREIIVIATPTPAPTVPPRPTPRTGVATRAPTPPPSTTPTQEVIAAPAAPQPLTRTLAIGVSGVNQSSNVWAARLRSFTERRPEIHAEVAPLGIGPAAQMALVRGADQGGLPDALLNLSGAALAVLAEREALAAFDAADAADRFAPELLALGRRAGSQLGLPLGGYPVYFYVNDRIVERAGVEQLGTSYTDRLETARRLTDSERHVYGWGAVADLPELETVAGSAGGRVWTPDGRAAALGEEAFVSAWQWYADLIRPELVAPPSSAWDGLLGTHAALLEGRIAMALRSGWVIEALGRLPRQSRAEVRLAPLPSWGERPRTVPVNAAYAAVAASSEVREDAQELAVFVASDGRDPSRDPGLPTWIPALDRYAAAQAVAAAELTETSAGWRRPALDHPRSVDVADVLMPAVSAVVAGGDAAAQHAAPLAARLDELARATGTE